MLATSIEDSGFTAEKLGQEINVTDQGRPDEFLDVLRLPLARR
jgi:hypothetical protein